MTGTAPELLNADPGRFVPGASASDQRAQGSGTRPGHAEPAQVPLHGRRRGVRYGMGQVWPIQGDEMESPALRA